MTTEMTRWSGSSWVKLFGLTEHDDGTIDFASQVTSQAAARIGLDTAASDTARFGHASALGTTGFRQRNDGFLSLIGANNTAIGLYQRNAGNTGYDTIAAFGTTSSAFNGSTFASDKSFVNGVGHGTHPVHGTSWDAVWGQWSATNWDGNDYAILVGRSGHEGTTLFNGWNTLELRVGNVTKLTLGATSIVGQGLFVVTGDLVTNGGWVYTTNTGVFRFAGSDVGWTHSGDNIWMRSWNDKSVWVGAGVLGSNGGLSINLNGGLTSGYGADINTPMLSHHITTRDGTRITSNGGLSGWYYQSSFIAQKYSSGDRASYSIFPVGVAYNIGATSSSPGPTAWTSDSSAGAPLYASSFQTTSSRRAKENIRPWPSKSLGAAVRNACERLTMIDVVSYQYKKEGALAQALGERREKALVRLNEFHAHRGSQPYERPLHDCATDKYCGGSAEKPCRRTTAYQNPHIGIVIEDLAMVLPEAAEVDDEGIPAYMRVGSMLGFLLAVCKEQEQRIAVLEARKVTT